MTTDNQFPDNAPESPLRTVAAASEWDTRIIRSSASTIEIQTEFNEADYYGSRPGSAIPTDQSKIMEMAESFYYQNGMVRSITDLIVEFATDGVKLHHNDEEMQKFFNVWASKISLRDRAERFATDLVRSGNVIVQRFYTQVTKPQTKKWKAEGSNIRYANEIPETIKSEIPIRYFFYRPSTIDIIGDDAAPYATKKMYGLRLDATIYTKMKNSLTKFEDRVKRSIPNIIERSGENMGARITYPLRTQDLYVAHYKKDDYLPWAYPLTYSVFPELIYNRKLRFVKTASLENFNCPIRLWKLGAHKEGIMVPAEAADKLQEMLLYNTGGGPRDLIWDDMIDCQEIYPPIKEIIDVQEDKDPILVCFGIADDLVGGVKGAGGQATNAYRIKAFIKKIQVVREILLEWLKVEIGLLCRALSFEDPPLIRFKFDDLTDERIYLTILRELVDRNVISDETMLEKLGESRAIEESRIAKETKQREDGDMPAKASPFHQPTLQEQHEMKLDEISKTAQEKPAGPNGRPPGKKDRMPRTKRSKAELLVKTNKLYKEIFNLAIEKLVKEVNIANARQMTAEHRQILDDIVDREFASLYIDNNDIKYSNDPNRYTEWYENFTEMLSGIINPTQEQIIMLKVAAHIEMGV